MSEEDRHWETILAYKRLRRERNRLLNVVKRLLETAEVCRECDWNVEAHELVSLLTSLEREAKEAIEVPACK